MRVAKITNGYQYRIRTHHLRRSEYDPPEGIDPEGGSDGEQLDASLTVFSDKDKGPSERRERQLDAHLPDWRNGKKNGNLLPLMRHDIYPVADPSTGFRTQTR